LGTGVIKAEVETRKNPSILPFMEMRRDRGGYNISERADTHPNNPETWARLRYLIVRLERRSRDRRFREVLPYKSFRGAALF
jgi:hypothetical protein